MVRVQPPEEKGHIAPEFAVGRLRPRTQHAIAVGARIEQDLLDEKGGGFADRFTGSALTSTAWLVASSSPATMRSKISTPSGSGADLMAAPAKESA